MPLPQSVTFVCLHGAAKSLIAAAYCEQMAAARGHSVRTAAFGIEPDAQIPSAVVEGLLREGIDVAGRQPTPLAGAPLDGTGLIISIGCDIAPVVDATGSRIPVVRWDDVPAVSDGYDAARDAIVARLERLLNDAS